MPPGDETYYNIRRMHVAFAAAVLALLAATVWMWAADSRRAWKEYQREYRSLRGLPARSPAIEQIWLPGLTIDYHFRGVARFDRCTTCHQGIDQPAASGLAQPYATHPRFDLFVGANSPHPMAEFGCTICHDGQGSATDFHWASHTPNDRRQRQRWQQELGWSDNPHWDYSMLARRLSESRCLVCHQDPVELEANVGGARGTGEVVGKASSILRNSSPTTSSAPFGDEPAAKLMAGYNLVRQYGCFGCHEIPAFGDVTHKVGPSLRKIAGKFDAEYLTRRIRNPADVLPSTRMPRLYGLDEHLSGRVLAETRKSEAAEIRAVVEYLLASAETVEPPTTPATAPPSVERGRRLFEMQGCLACHRHRDFPKGQAMQGPDLSNVGKNYLPGSGRRWLAGWIADPARYSPQTLMPHLLLQLAPLEDGQTADPAADLAAYLMDRQGLGTSVPSGSVGKSAVGSRQSPADRDFARRTIARRGCAGCHDIPGLENALPIGPTLAGWARKPESMLAFERINDFMRKPLAVSQGQQPDDDFFTDALSAHRRQGFVWQKLRAPRSFDYAIADGKPIDEQLKMGRFELTDAQREATAVFILAQVEKSPSGGKGDRSNLCEAPGGPFRQIGSVPFSAPFSASRRKAVIEGRKVIDKYACTECHTLALERWTINGGKTQLSGMLRLDRQGVVLEDEDEDGKPQRYFTLWSPAVIDGHAWPVGGADIAVSPLPTNLRSVPGEGPGVRASSADESPLPNSPHPNPLPKGEGTSGEASRNYLLAIRPPWGGALARLLYPAVLADARQNGLSAAEMEAWGWLPPALVHEGTKVQPEWLFRFLLDPTPIRPAAVLRMPRFNLSRSEAGKLADYFAAVADAEYPYTPKPVAASAPLDVARLDRAMRLVLDRTTFCSKCHTIGDSGWGGSSTAAPTGDRNRTILAPRLDEVGRRLRPEYLRRWLADPKSVLPYTAMPSLFPLSGKPLGQEIFPGSSQQQLDAVIELLLRYEEYEKHRTPTPAP